MITIGMAARPEDGPPPGCPVRVDDFRAWDPVTDKPRLRIIVWRNGDVAELRRMDEAPPLAVLNTGADLVDN